MLRLRPIPTIFPYTTLFRSHPGNSGGTVFATRACMSKRWTILPALGALVAATAHAESPIEPSSTDAGTPDLIRPDIGSRSEEHTSELQSLRHLVCRLLLEKK